MEKTIVLIDAGFLSKLSKYLGDDKYLTYDLIKFSKNLANKEGSKRYKIYDRNYKWFKSFSLYV